MTEEIREQLSALIDDELSDLERPLLLGRLQRDAALRECLGRYQLIGEVMRGAGKTATLSVAGRVQQAVEQEAAMLAAARPAARHWKPLAGMGVAASVALLAVFAVTSLRDSTTETVPAVASGDAGVKRLASENATGDERWDRIEPRIDERLSGYLVNHSEYAASRGVQGMMPYVRIVGFDNER
ncbi:MAG: RseA family anti-sigma factor [Gammaproteobacteria bacterium]|jgi:sigma-E factor negative regulatory protein RseA